MQRSGISLVETVVSTLLVGILMTTSLQTVGMSLRQQMTSTQNVIAAALANGLMSEIATQSYMEPGASTSAISGKPENRALPEPLTMTWITTTAGRRHRRKHERTLP